METQSASSARDTRITKVALTQPSPTIVPPIPRETPGAAQESARPEGVLNSPVAADPPADERTESPPKSRSILGTPGAPTDAGGDSEVASAQVDDKMSYVKPDYQPLPVNPKTFCQPYNTSSTTTIVPASDTANIAVTSPTQKGESTEPFVGKTNVVTSNTAAISPPLRVVGATNAGSTNPESSSPPIRMMGATKVGVTESNPSTPHLRVVSPNSVPVKKRSAFRAETGRSSVDQCIQGGGRSRGVGNDVCEKSLVSNTRVLDTGVENSVKSGEKHSTGMHEKRERENVGETTSNVSANSSMNDLNSVAESQQGVPSSVPRHTVGIAVSISTETAGVGGKVVTDKQFPSSETVVRSEGIGGIGSAESQPPGSVVVPATSAQLGVTAEASRRVNTLKPLTTTVGKSTSPSKSNGEDPTKAVSRSNRSYPGSVAGPPSQPCYPPLYLPSSCHVTLGRESGRAPKDGSKVHATTFIPDMGEFIPGPASSTREPLARVGRSGPSGHDGQTSMKATEHLKGFVQSSSKVPSPKDSKKGVTRQAGPLDVVPSKIQKRDGKGSPSGDRTFPRIGSPVGGSGGIRMTEAPARADRRSDGYNVIDGARKMRDLASYGMKSPSGMKPGDLSVITHHHGYQPLSAIASSPPGQKTSSVSPRDRKPTDLRGIGDVKGVLGEYSDKQRQMWDWHLATASQHRTFYEPWKSTAGFGIARTSMLTSHSNTLSTQESVLRSALLHSGAHTNTKHGTATSHSTATAMVSPKMTPATVEASASKAADSVGSTPKHSKREEPAKKTHLGKVNFGEHGSGRGTPNSRSGEGTRNPPVGIALVQQRQESEKRTDARGSTGSSQRDRSDDRRHLSRGTFSPHRDVRSTDSHRERRPSSNSSQPSRVSPHNPNLIVTGGTSLTSHAPDFLAHPGAFLPQCYSRFPAGHHSPSQPLWLPQPFALPAAAAHGPSPLTSSYQDVPLPGNVGLQAREGVPSRPLMMFPPHLSATEGALHGIGTWPPPYLLSTPLHPQLNPSLYAAPFTHLPPGGPAMGPHVPLLPGQTDPPHPSDVHALFQQQHEAVLNWYRAMELHRRGAYSAMTDTTHPLPHHGTDRTRKQSGGGRKSTEGKSEHDRKQPKSETQPHDSCGRTSREAVEEKLGQQATPSIIPPFIPVPPHGSMPLFYSSPYLLDPTKRDMVQSHSPSDTSAKVEKRDAGTSSHSPASRPASRERQKVPEVEGAKSVDGSLKTACVQTLPPDKINEKETADSEKIDVEETDDARREAEKSKEAEKLLDSEPLVVEDAEDKHLRLQKASRVKEGGEIEAEEDRSRTSEPAEKDTENDQKEASSPLEEKEESAVVENKGEEAKEGSECAAPSEAPLGDQGTQSEGATAEAVQSGESDSWIANYPSCLEGQRRESLITSVMSTTQSVASKIEAVDQEQLAAIEGIALLSEVAEQKTFEAICNQQDDDPDVPDSGAVVDEAEKLTVTPESDPAKDVPAVQPPLSVSINTEEMKLNQLVELQRRYKERKKEYDKLQRKKEKKEKNEKAVGEQTKKRGPGRPRKRKNSVKVKKNDGEHGEERVQQPRILQSSADVLLEAAASLEEEEPAAPPIKKKKREKKKSRPKKDANDVAKADLSTSSIQSSADVLLEAAASLEQPPAMTKKRKKEKKDKKMKNKREILSTTGKDLKKKKKKLSKRKETEDSLANSGKTKKKNKHSSTEMVRPSSTLGGLDHPTTGRKKLGAKSGEKKRKGSKVKSGILPEAPEAIDLPAPEGASLPMYTEAKNKSSKNGLSISHVYGDSSDSDDEDSSHCSFTPVPKGLALLASTAELSSGSSTPVKRASKKLLNKKKLKAEDSVARKRASLESTAAAAKKLKLSKKREKLRLQKTLKKGRKLNPKKTPQKSPRGGGSVEETPPKFDAAMWSRRRSERIFLNDASPQQSREVSPQQETGRARLKLDLGSPSKTAKVEPPLVSPIIGTVLDALKTDPFQMRQKFSQMSESEDDDDDDSDGDKPREAELAIRRKASRDKLNALMKEVDSDSDQDLNSDAEDMPLSSLVDSEPAPRICNLRVGDLVEGQNVLVPFDNLFYEGKIHPIRPPDVYGVVFESRRGNRPHVYSQEQILEDVIADVKPNSVKYLPEGTRICAYWSQQFNCLYPGTVVKGAPNTSGDKKMVTVEFDDGDSGRIPLDYMRMLPQDYPLISDLGSSSIPLERKLRQRNTETSCNLDDIREAGDGRKKGFGKGKGKARKGKSISEVGDDEVFLPNTTTPVKKPRGRKPKNRIKSPPATKLSLTPTDPTCPPVKKRRGRPRKIRPEETQPRKKGRPPKKPVSGSVTLAKKINKFYAGRKKASQQKAARMGKPGARPRGRPPGSKSKVKGQSMKKAKSPTKVKVQARLSPEILDPARAAMMRYTGPDDSEDAGTLGESDIASTIDEDEVGRKTKVPIKKRKGSKSNKAVYSPERQLWRWLGNATQRKGSKGKAKKVFYKAIVRGKEVIRVNECAVFLSTGRPHLPYIGRIESMWESWGEIMVVRVKWCYHPEETNGCAANIEGKMALYQSSHVDENDIQTISHKCEVLSREEYKLRAMGKIPKNSVIDNEDVYYLAGTYDPTTGRMTTFQ